MAPQNGWLFPTESGLPIHPNNFRERIWKRFFSAERRPLIPYRGPHVLRHTYASLLIFQGFDLVYVKGQLGHKSIRITVDTYGHLVQGESIRAVDSLDDAPEVQKRKPGVSENFQRLELIRGGLD